MAEKEDEAAKQMRKDNEKQTKKEEKLEKRKSRVNKLKILTNEQLISSARNGATRSKWLFGLYVGLIAIIDNNLFENLPVTKKIIILASLLGAVLNGLAMTNFEKIQFELERETTDESGKKTDVLKAEPTLDRLELFSLWRNWMAFAILIGFLAGLFLVVSMFWEDLPKLICFP